MSAVLVFAAAAGAVVMFQLGAQSAWLAMVAILFRLLLVGMLLGLAVTAGKWLRNRLRLKRFV